MKRCTVSLLAILTLVAIGCGGGSSNSTTPPPPHTQATPTFSPGASTYPSTQSVAIMSSGADHIYFTTNGSTPTVASTLYSGPVSVAVTESLSAFATRVGYTDSAIGSAVYTITPTPPVLTTITVSPATASITVGQTQAYTAAAVDQYGRPFTVSSYTWASDNPNVAMIVNGTASGLGAGTADITASANGVTSQNAVLTVVPPSPPVLTSITLTPPVMSVQMGVGRSVQTYTATGFDQYGNPFSTQLYYQCAGGSCYIEPCTIQFHPNQEYACIATNYPQVGQTSNITVIGYISTGGGWVTVTSNISVATVTAR
jgi:hypothetical protein